MNTLLPYPDFTQSAKVLTQQHLEIQRLDVLQILNVLHSENPDSGYLAPIVRMWRGYEPQLAEYGLVICQELTNRGFYDYAIRPKIKWHMSLATSGEYTMKVPPWVRDERLHLSHRSRLLQVDYPHYSQYFDPETPLDLPYFWPEGYDERS